MPMPTARLSAAALVAATCALIAASAVAADGPMSINNPSGLRPGELPQTLRDRGGMEEGAGSPTRKPLFTLQTMTFSFVDPTANSRFVRQLAESQREADVRVVDSTKGLDKVFLYRASCPQRTFYFGPAPKAEANIALKPIEGGSVGDLLYQQVCG